jgi:hypothetical protein
MLSYSSRVGRRDLVSPFLENGKLKADGHIKCRIG